MSGSDIRGISNGPNARPLNDTMAGSGPGIPDDALAPGEEMDKGEVVKSPDRQTQKSVDKPTD